MSGPYKWKIHFLLCHARISALWCCVEDADLLSHPIFLQSTERYFNSHAVMKGSARTRSLVFAWCGSDGVVTGC